jgi:hypothetical protein
MTRFTRFGSLVVGALLLAATAAPAVERPLFGRGTGRFISPTDFVNEGTGTYVGHFQEAGSVVSAPTGDPTVVSIEGASILTAANGDQLYIRISGELDLLTGAVTLTTNYVGGTGRFAAVSGTASITGRVNADGSFDLVVRGTLDF